MAVSQLAEMELILTHQFQEQFRLVEHSPLEEQEEQVILLVAMEVYMLEAMLLLEEVVEEQGFMVAVAVLWVMVLVGLLWFTTTM
jgi:hypothetical protein